MPRSPGGGQGGRLRSAPPGSLPHSSPEPLGQTAAHAGHPMGPLPCGSWDRRPGTAWGGRAQAPSAPPPRRSRGSQERRGGGGLLSGTPGPWRCAARASPRRALPFLCLTKEPSPVGQSGCEQTSWGRASSALTSSRCFSRASRRQRAGHACPSEPGPVRCRVAQFSCPCFDCRAPGRFFLLAAVKSSARGTLEEMSVSGHFLVDSETRPAVVLGARPAAVRRDGWRGSSLAHCCRRPLTTPPSVLQAS